MREILIATYSDDAAKLTLAWSLREARTDGRKKGSAVSGTVIVFAAEDRRDGFVEHSKRRGIGVEVLLGDATKPWRVIVADTYPKADLP